MRRIALLASALILAATLTGCGSDEPETEPPTDQTPSATEEPTEEPMEATEDTTPEGPRQIDITFKGGSAPQVERVQVDAGEAIELVIKSDTPGELHVHSDPEQTIAYKAGTTTAPLTIDRPGVVEVERHEPEALVLQLEVR